MAMNIGAKYYKTVPTPFALVACCDVETRGSQFANGAAVGG